MCLLTILVSAAIGFVVGIVPWVDTPNWTVWMTVMAARHPPEEQASASPLLPRAAFLSLLFAGVPLIKGWCPLFPSHIFLASMLVIFWISTGTWLLSASALRSRADAERKTYIEQFTSSKPGREPPPKPHSQAFPAWLRVWEGINLAAYFLMIASILRSLAALLDA
jgi:hypothetical protein